MFSILRYLVIALMVSVFPMCTAAFGAAPLDTVNFNGGSASAGFVYGDWFENPNTLNTTGCVLGNLSITVFQGISHSNGSGGELFDIPNAMLSPSAPSSTAILIQWSELNFCPFGVSGEFPIVNIEEDGLVFINDSDFSVDKNMQQANLNTEFQIANTFSNQPIV
jgi:hypothetical protein